MPSGRFFVANTGLVRFPGTVATSSHPEPAMFRLLLAAAMLVAVAFPASAQNPREKKVRDDKVKVEADGFWIYNNLPRAFEQARKELKPIVVVMRCLPCEECVKLDDNLVDKDPVLRPLLEKFVRVRVVSTNGLDLS